MKKALHWLNEYLEEFVLVIGLILMTLIMGIQVFCRYVLGMSLPWSEELTRYIFIWCGFQLSMVSTICFSISTSCLRHLRHFVLCFPFLCWVRLQKPYRCQLRLPSYTLFKTFTAFSISSVVLYLPMENLTTVFSEPGFSAFSTCEPISEPLVQALPPDTQIPSMSRLKRIRSWLWD